jgi:hypothetical protein
MKNVFEIKLTDQELQQAARTRHLMGFDAI